MKSLLTLKKGIKARRGFSLIDTVVASALSVLLMIGVARLSLAKMGDFDTIDEQFAVLTADAFIADMYDDFHSSVSYRFEETVAGQKNLTFVASDGVGTVYTFSPADGACFIDGIRQFDADSMDVIITPADLFLNLKLPGEHLLELNVHR